MREAQRKKVDRYSLCIKFREGVFSLSVCGLFFVVVCFLSKISSHKQELDWKYTGSPKSGKTRTLERACCLRKHECLGWPGLGLFVSWKDPAGVSCWSL